MLIVLVNLLAKAPEVILAIDCGSTTSKARLFKKMGDEFRYVCSGEAPTTVEAPYEDVTLGVQNAIREVIETTGMNLLSGDKVKIRSSPNEDGVDLFVCTSSAGGGLQMMVAGVMKNITAESAERAALGAGSIVMDVLAKDDGKSLHEKIEQLRFLRPDIILLAGGTDGGDSMYILQLSEYIAIAKPKARLGIDFKLPIVYAGNKYVTKEVEKLLGGDFVFEPVDNIRPEIDIENPEPARAAIARFFMEHVMSHAPGYNKLMKWTHVPIMPTPMGEGTMVQLLAKSWNCNVIGVGLGGATTNVYSIYNGKFVRTVSANLGMSYSICNVLKEAGIEMISRWLPFFSGDKEGELLDKLSNKMIRPTTIPQTLGDLMVEHAVAREALRLGFEHHKRLARELRGKQVRRTVSEMFDQKVETGTYINMFNVDVICGTGGLLSHAPRRAQSAIMLIDGFQPKGITKLAQDSVFMMPHLGVLSTVHPKIALEIFEKDCLVRLGTCIAPSWENQINEGEKVVTITGCMPDGNQFEKDFYSGEIEVISIEAGKEVELEISPSKHCNVGAGLGEAVKKRVEGGEVGIIVDTRGRPLMIPQNESERRKRLLKWYQTMNLYPEELLEGQS
jgi:uncharacterized protein (TIGR01319 family)